MELTESLVVLSSIPISATKLEHTNPSNRQQRTTEKHSTATQSETNKLTDEFRHGDLLHSYTQTRRTVRSRDWFYNVVRACFLSLQMSRLQTE